MRTRGGPVILERMDTNADNTDNAGKGERTVRLHDGPLDGRQVLSDSTHGALMEVTGEFAYAIYKPEEGQDPDVWAFQGWHGGSGTGF